ncbi:hypothetical protein AAFN85_10555 [Mucilaginibacter sp. CAU 1740]|uniref:hypothetical protein n=1 Tax=Mucilaginibacter sp. CAU 1740 TaxID=3140365 RepID=UPI00325B1833
MKRYITCLILATTLFSCRKLTNTLPTPSKGNNTTEDSGSGSSSATVKLDIATQIVTTKVTDDVLYLNYVETVNLILNPDEYQKSSAVHFKEDFSKTSLANFSFTTINKENQVATNYLEDNLNNVVIKSATTVTIDGKKFTKLVLERELVFSKAYKQADLAIEAQNDILKKSGETIGFSSYYYIDGKNSTATTATANILYKK